MSKRAVQMERERNRARGATGTMRFHRNATAVTDKKRTIYIGNLDRRVTEYMLIKLFQKFGKMTRINFTWHKVGERRGTPRGYAFIEYKNREECVRAQKAMDGKLCLGRHLTVRYAADKEYDDDNLEATDSSKQPANDRNLGVKMSAADKIRAIQEKLKKMR
eukprot:CAMPEP_0197539726 /NCGR_PEP_ID=MMETSP1318-20131121/63631_1 /TAXON_ID=552666 /ORGANISM="Partenskyella glossopodia, Strain RCC365" /LENGTH=161 /DNA_ID=CAMNT_0043098507 /DNA_START=89 /DNA_END=570 /DNA_ORIENTATION=+